ncbi:MAG: stress responsive protein [Clostridiales bacterium GWF2_38_85]|nr:MAG: stress responsive protein [Clostridiales bacterium GWF2_38_85]HBL83332.1 stress responsive protein [Clostridiales bacterium]
MIKHIVCFKLKDNSIENCQKAKDVLMSMQGNVPTVKDISVGIDFLHSQRSYDLILQVTLESREVLDEYQNDTFHVDVVKKHMHAVAESSIAVDYEL